VNDGRDDGLKNATNIEFGIRLMNVVRRVGMSDEEGEVNEEFLWFLWFILRVAEKLYIPYMIFSSA
jgi:hypothetical protein